MSARSRVIIASNRLPFVFGGRGHDGGFTPAAGGLATGLRAFHDRGESLWVGWSGEAFTRTVRRSQRMDAELRARRIVPVHLERSVAGRYYDGVCNTVLWPLLHSHIERIPASRSHWDTYRAVNQRFAAAIAGEYRPGDTIWIHDYHLLLVPQLVRQALPHAAIGFFLHVPFPALDVFRVFPWRREIVEGMLGATVVGFHTTGYAAHFAAAVSCCALRERRGAPPRVGSDVVRVGAYPMGIDAASFDRLGRHPEVDRELTRIRDGERLQILVGVDRLDHTKGIPQRLLAFDRLLRESPQFRTRVSLIQVAVPSRERVCSYRRLRREIEALVGRINGEHGTVDWTPIRYIHRSVSTIELAGLYRSADVMLVTPLRDGMNLVAKEFVASRADGDGVLVLSEFAGAADQLPEALLVNPYSIDQMADTMRTALTMTESERRQRLAALRTRVVAQDVHSWAARFVADVRRCAAERTLRRQPDLPSPLTTSSTLIPNQPDTAQSGPGGEAAMSSCAR